MVKCILRCIQLNGMCVCACKCMCVCVHVCVHVCKIISANYSQLSLAHTGLLDQDQPLEAEDELIPTDAPQAK